MIFSVEKLNGAAWSCVELVSAWGRGRRADANARDIMVGFDWRIPPVAYPCKLHWGDITPTFSDDRLAHH